jgi:hypothetical protein
MRLPVREPITSQMITRIDERLTLGCAAAFAGEIGPPSFSARRALALEGSPNERGNTASGVSYGADLSANECLHMRRFERPDSGRFDHLGWCLRESFENDKW